MNPSQSLVEKLNPNWYSVAIINILVLGILMLFYKELTPISKQYLIPSLVIYTIGNALIGHIQGSYFRNSVSKKDSEEPLFLYYGLYAVWFFMLIGYLFYRSVI